MSLATANDSSRLGPFEAYLGIDRHLFRMSPWQHNCLVYICTILFIKINIGHFHLPQFTFTVGTERERLSPSIEFRSDWQEEGTSRPQWRASRTTKSRQIPVFHGASKLNEWRRIWYLFFSFHRNQPISRARARTAGANKGGKFQTDRYSTRHSPFSSLSFLDLLVFTSLPSFPVNLLVLIVPGRCTQHCSS
jgi:hypothetical protein